MLLLPAALLVCLIFQHSGQKDCITAIYLLIFELTFIHTLCSMVRLYTHKLGFSQYELEKWMNQNYDFLNLWVSWNVMWFHRRRKIGQKLLSLTKMSRRHNFLGSRLKKQKCTEEVIWLGFLASLETSPTTYPKIKKKSFLLSSIE